MEDGLAYLPSGDRDMDRSVFVESGRRSGTVPVRPLEMPGPVRQAVTYIVTGTPGAQVACGPAGINLTGSVLMDVTTRLGDLSYCAINAQPDTMLTDDLGELHAELIGREKDPPT